VTNVPGVKNGFP